MKLKQALTLIFGIVRSIRTPINEKIDMQHRVIADLRADRQVYYDMLTYYAGRAGYTDPNTDWWTFADYKEKWSNECKLHDRANRKVDAAVARLNALERSVPNWNSTSEN